MADNVTITAGSGTTIAADDIAGVLHQRVKISQGADGSATDVSSASPLNVTLANTGANATPIVVDLGANNDVTVTGTVTVASHAVTNAGTFATQESGALLTAAQLLDDAVVTDNGAFTDGTTKLQMGGFIYDEVAGTALTENDAAAGRINVNRAQVATIEDGVTRGRYATVSASNALKVDGSAVTQPVSGTVTANAGTGTMAVSMATNTPVGNVAHDAADSGAPVKTGGRARTSDITSVANDDRTDSVHTKNGFQVVFPFCLPENLVSGAITTAMTGTTSTSLIAAPGAGLYNYITQVTVSNSHATVGTDVTLQDGNGGTAFYTIPAAAVYGGASIQFNPPLRQPTSNTALYCVNITTGASTKVSASGFKGA